MLEKQVWRTLSGFSVICYKCSGFLNQYSRTWYQSVPNHLVQTVESLLWHIPPKHLDRFIEEYLMPDTNSEMEIQNVIDRIASFLKEKCFQEVSEKSVQVTKVVKGGSSGNGTALRSCSDAHLVVFLSNLQSYGNLIGRCYREVIKEIKRRLEEWEQEQGWQFKIKFEVNKKPKPGVLSFRMTSKLNGHWFTLTGQMTPNFRPDPLVYIDLLSESRENGKLSTSFIELQKRFLEQRHSKLKCLILLVKHWYKMCKKKMKSLPPQYALELLTVYAWEHGSQETHFSTARGFRTVLYLIEKYQELLVYWTVNYAFDDTIGDYLRSKLKKPRPVILDPADATGDVGGGYRWCWDKLAQEAQRWASAPCFQNWDDSLVQPWDVQLEQAVKGRSGFSLPRYHTYSEEAFSFDHSIERATDCYYPQCKPGAQKEPYCIILSLFNQP
ncbi:2'-5'-oligoadenylate synthase 1-like [Macrotis lagotis]|uniref:2'-5'-oligoadenylate synthase 1-like n=1 Tax=Macrotis lagotis TaxID=92651 RepID=UPI003D6813E2